MKKFLLSIFALMLAVLSVQAQEIVTFDFTSPSTLSPSFSTPEASAGIDIEGAVFTNGVANFTATDGTTNTRIWNASGTCELRVYKNAVITISVPEGYVITNVSNTGTQVNWSADGKTRSVSYTATGTLKIKTVTVTYEVGETQDPEEPVVPEEPETPEDGISWNLVEDVNDIEAGDEVIIVADGYDVALGALSGSYHTSTPVVVSDNTLTDTGEAIILTVGKNGDNYTFSYNSVYLYWSSTSKNTLTTTSSVDSYSSWNIEIANGVATISNVGNNNRKLQYNVSAPRFACYTGTQQSVCIYKKTELLHHTLTVTDAGWATLYLAASARIPSTVEAYIVKAVHSGWVELNQVTGVIPANTGIIVKADAGDYNFFMGETATADVTGNLLSGSAYNRNFDEEAYVLSKVGDVVGLYKAEMTDGVWLNNANKAFLPANALTPAQQTVAFYGFEWGGTTGIDEITDNREQSTAIFDLSGRRIENITAPGIYIVNGKKVLVK